MGLCAGRVPAALQWGENESSSYAKIGGKYSSVGGSFWVQSRMKGYERDLLWELGALWYNLFQL